MAKLSVPPWIAVAWSTLVLKLVVSAHASGASAIKSSAVLKVGRNIAMLRFVLIVIAFTMVLTESTTPVPD